MSGKAVPDGAEILVVRQQRFVLAVLIMFSLGSVCARATDGNELIGIGAVQKGTAGAGVAAPQDAMWILLNPASIIALERRVDVSAEFLDLYRGAEPHGFPLIVNPTAFELADHGTIFVPSVALVWPLKVGTIGFGLLGTQGNNADFDRSRTTWPFSRGNDRRSDLQVARMPISYAYQFDNGWTIGGSIMPVLTAFRTDSLTLQLRPTEGDYKREVGWGIGVQVAVYKEWERLSFGATWRSRQAVEQYKLYEEPIRWNLDLPEVIQAGFAWKVTDKLQLLADYKFQHWSKLKQFHNPTIKGGLGWNDQNIYKIGAIYRANDKWTFRTGYSRGNPAVDEQHIFANIITPAIAEDHFTFGFTRKLTKNSDFHFAWTHTFPEDRKDDGTGDIFSKLGKGSRVQYEEDAYTFQYTYKF
ncbi:MAG: outer membrane protein transport protein [Candidatus Hydrogenedentes bacterium]|nr:outer membrane protein transport protein [Candidatus Hydrogenedentota bacterium]